MMCVLVGRIVWTALLSIAFAGAVQNAPAPECESGWYGLPTYLGVAVGIFLLSIVNCTCICWVGLTGLIFETERRLSMSRLLRVQMVVMALELLCAAFGVVVFADHYLFPCTVEEEEESTTTRHELALILIVMLSQVADLVVFFCCCCSTRSRRIDKYHKKGVGDAEAVDSEAALPKVAANFTDDDNDNDNDNDNDDDKEEEGEDIDVFVVWVDRVQRIINRVRCFCCNILGGTYVCVSVSVSVSVSSPSLSRTTLNVNHLHTTLTLTGKAVEQGDLENVARIMTKFFHHSGFLDVVPGDALAGLILLRMLQRKEMERAENTNPVFVDCPTAGEIHVQQQSQSAKLMKQLLLDSMEPISEIEGTHQSMNSVVDDDANGDNQLPSGNGSGSASPNPNLNSPNSPNSPRIRRGSRVMIGNDHAHGEVRGKANAVAHSLRRTYVCVPSLSLSYKLSLTSHSLTPTTTGKLSPDSHDDRNLLEDISDLMPYCLAMYTALFVALLNPCSFACRLCASGCIHKGKHRGKIDGDKYVHVCICIYIYIYACLYICLSTFFLTSH